LSKQLPGNDRGFPPSFLRFSPFERRIRTKTERYCPVQRPDKPNPLRSPPFLSLHGTEFRTVLPCQPASPTSFPLFHRPRPSTGNRTGESPSLCRVPPDTVSTDPDKTLRFPETGNPAVRRPTPGGPFQNTGWFRTDPRPETYR